MFLRSESRAALPVIHSLLPDRATPMRHLARPVSRHTHRYETFDVMSHYVCAFRGRRDNYQVPLTLAEAGQLDRFITDAYVPAG